MPRKRLVSPEFFTHPELYQHEADTMLPLRLAFAGLWTQADKRGVFEWKPTQLRLAILPYDSVNFAAVLDALQDAGFIRRYVVDGKAYGVIENFTKWQTFNVREKPSAAPAPPQHRASTVSVPDTVSAPVQHRTDMPGTGTGTGTGTGAGAGTAAPSQHRASTVLTDPVSDFIARYPFAENAGTVEGWIRASRLPEVIMGVLTGHLEGMGQEMASAERVGRALLEYAATEGKEPGTLNPRLFAAFVRGVGKSEEVTVNRQRNTVEQKFIDTEAADRAKVEAEEREARALVERFAQNSPERFAELQQVANAKAPPGLAPELRGLMVDAALATLVRRENGAHPH